ncbi:DNA modification system-associated small protein [Paenibacillus hexagrammi]|uniref:Antirepressor AbbA n=1 Tax=Paenibacillus hexagrammi TaxID=2908839 RepID=A0ABY3SG21_9BACL|nr:DNA modification system-associated small protein [Paenibacillus sp. YPD9-1]UJF32659.1 hypothetical protein L0M14_24020 [Paenibacillus sp. YPD9-1]
MTSSSLKEQEQLLLKNLCLQHGISTELISKLLASAEENNYSNKSMNERRTDYINLINFYNKKSGQ